MLMRRIAGSALAFAGIIVSTAAFAADQPITLETRLAQPVMKAGAKQTNFLRIGLNGCKPERTSERAPVNVAFVIDRSGSMGGERIAQAREAAIMAVNRLDEKDFASVVIFDDRIEVLVPSQKVSNRNLFIDAIRQIGVRGSTAIYAGVSEGANEVRKNLDARRLNRVVLLSDGRANVGPRNPDDFALLGADLLKSGISVSTIGLGRDYNEDLMLKLARAADGNHAFAAAPDDLIKIFNKEFDDVLAACAQTVSIDVELAPGARVVRAVSRDGEIAPAHAKFQMNQIYQGTEHYILLEVEFDGKPASPEREFGRVRVSYTVPDSGSKHTLTTTIRGGFSSSAEAVKAKTDRTVMASVIEQSTRARAQQAVRLGDLGRLQEASKLFEANVADIEAYLAAGGASSDELQNLARQYKMFASRAASAPPAQWGLQRKQLRALDLNEAGTKFRY